MYFSWIKSLTAFCNKQDHLDEETLMYVHRQSFNELNFKKWWIISTLEVISHLSTLHLLPRLHCTSSWWMNVPLAALATRTNHVCCCPSALIHPATNNTPRTWGMEKQARNAASQSRIWRYGKHLRAFDVKIKTEEDGAPAPHSISLHLFVQ